MRNPSRSLGAALLLFFSTAINATSITYDLVNIGGNTWEYTYNISNDTLLGGIEEFTVFFDYTLYVNLSITTIPADWDPIAIQPDPGLPDDGFYDALALVTGIAPGGSLGGFGVQFDYLGVGTPGDQSFDIIDSNTFATLDSGTTQLAAVPIPAAIWLFGTGLISLLGVSRYK